MPVMVAIKHTGERKKEVTHLKLKKKTRALQKGKQGLGKARLRPRV